MTRPLLILIACVLFTATAGAEVYKWVDEKGVIHYQDHPRGQQAGGISTDEQSTKVDTKEIKKLDSRKVVRDMEKARKRREKERRKKLAERQKQDEKCMILRSKLRKLEAKMDKNYSEFSNDRPPSYQRQQADLTERKKYINKYCN